MLSVRTNTASMSAITHLTRTTRSLSSTFERISSGLRVNRAADDAAGLAVAENLDAQGRSLRVAMRNTNDGVSLIQTAEGAASEVGSILKRMRELAVESSSETLADSERAYIQDEFSELSAEVDRIASVTNFNGVQLADGSSTQLAVQVGIHDSGDDRIQITLGDLRASSIGITGTVSLATSGGAQDALTAIDGAIDQVNEYRSGFGASQNRLQSALNNSEVYTENLAAAESRIRDADFAYESAEMTKFQIMQQAGVAVLGQANGLNQAALRLIG